MSSFASCQTNVRGLVGGTKQRLGVSVVIADTGREHEGLTPNQLSITSTVVAFKVEPLSPCSTGLAVKAAMPQPAPCGAPEAPHDRRDHCLSYASQPTILRLYRSRIRYKKNQRPITCAGR